MFKGLIFIILSSSTFNLFSVERESFREDWSQAELKDQQLCVCGVMFKGLVFVILSSSTFNLFFSMEREYFREDWSQAELKDQ